MLIENLRWYAFYCDRTNNGCQARNILREAADALEKLDRHGKWIEHTDSILDTYYDCSACGESFYLVEGTPDENCYKYCPNCGADMREDKNA